MLAAACSAAALACVGAFLVTRQAAVQTLAVSQGAGLGVSLGLLASQFFFDHGHLEHTAIPLIFGLLVGGMGFAATEWIARKSHTQTVIYLGAFALLWGLSQLVTGFFPTVESHSPSIYFGDIVTLTMGESVFFFGLASASAAYLLWRWKDIADQAFLASILNEPFRFRNTTDLSFYAVTLLLLCFSVQLLGLMFTLSCLFLPTAVYSFSLQVGVARHLRRVSVSAALAAAIGFELSLLDSRFLTSPLITLLLAALPGFHLLAERLLFRRN